MRTLILFFILIIHLAVAGEFIKAQEIKASEPYTDEGYMQGMDTGGHGLEVSAAYPDYYIGEIHIVEAWVKSYDLEVNGIPVQHYHIIPVHLVSKDILFEVCERPGQILPHETAGCFNNWYIYIINGAQGLPPSNQGCSILYHELLHAEGLYDPEIAQQYPNERCAV